MNKAVARFERELDVVNFVKMQRMIRLALKTLFTDMQQSYEREQSVTASIKGSLSQSWSEERQTKQFRVESSPS